MSAAPRRRRRVAARPPRVVRVAALVVGAAAIFVLGVGFGQALERNDRAEGRRTDVRTLKPLSLPPARRTVTVTVTR